MGVGGGAGLLDGRRRNTFDSADFCPLSCLQAKEKVWRIAGRRNPVGLSVQPAKQIRAPVFGTYPKRPFPHNAEKHLKVYCVGLKSLLNVLNND